MSTFFAKARKLRFESLEKRELLSVNASQSFGTLDVSEQDYSDLESVCAVSFDSADSALDSVTSGCRECVFSAVDAPLTSEGLSASNSTLDVQLQRAGQNPSSLAKSFVFNLNSNPTATRTIYLDFDGHTASGTLWRNGATVKTPAYDVDGKAGFSNQELRNIYEIWLRVSEDFAPFNVNVTTKEPTAAQLSKSSSSDSSYGVRVCVGGSSSDWFGQKTDGVSLEDSFTWNSDTPCYIFSKNASSVSGLADLVSHEVGHTLGLKHDGHDSQEHYFGANGWAPIMGGNGLQTLTQWSKGEYSGATNKQDDLAVMTQSGKLSYRADDHGNTNATAQAIKFSTSGVLASGIIEKNTDVDYFSFSYKGEKTYLTIGGIEGVTNLDAGVAIYNAQKKLVAKFEPSDSTYVTIDMSKYAAGTYYLSVYGTGRALDGQTVYTKYGSLGAYTIEASTHAPSYDGYEPNGTFATAYDLGEIASKTTLELKRGQDQPIDWFKFTTVAAGTIETTLNCAFVSKTTDLNIALYRESGELIIDAKNKADIEKVLLESYAPSTYYLKIYNNYANNLDVSYTVTIDPPTYCVKTPTLTVSSSGSNSIKAAIGAISGATRYELEYSTQADFANAQSVSFDKSGAKTIDGLFPSTTYYVRVRAVVPDEYSYPHSAWRVGSATTAEAPRLPAPTLKAAANAYSVALEVGEVENAEYYVIEYDVASNFANAVSLLVNPGATTVSGLTANTKYYFRVKAAVAADAAYSESKWSTTGATPTAIKLDAPEWTIVKTTSSACVLTIDAVDDAANYVVEYALSSDFSDAVTKNYPSAGTKTISGLTANTQYYVRVKAIGAPYDDSAWTTATATTAKVALPAPELTTISVDAQSATLQIGKIDGAASYSLQYSTNAKFTNAATLTVSSGECRLSDLEPSTQYYVRVKAAADPDSALDSAWTSISATTLARLANPAVTATPAATGVSLKIVDVDGAESYVVEYGTDPTFQTSSTKTFAATGAKTITGLTADAQYYLRVLARAEGYGDSQWTELEVRTKTNGTVGITRKPTLAAPQVAAEGLANNAISLTIDGTGVSSAYLASYSVQYSLNADFTDAATLDCGDGPYLLTGLQADSTYYIRVRSIAKANLAYNSAWTTVTAQTLPDATLSPTLTLDSATATSAIATIGECSNAESYKLQFSSDPEFVDAQTIVVSTSGEIELDDLAPGVRYYFRVKANFEDSDWSETAEIQTLDGAIANPAASEELVVANGNGLRLQALGANGTAAIDDQNSNLTYWWDLSDSHNVVMSNFVPGSQNLWFTPNDTPDDLVVVRVLVKDGENVSNIVEKHIRIDHAAISLNADYELLLGGDAIYLTLESFHHSVIDWVVDWHDGSEVEFHEAVGTNIVLSHFFETPSSDPSHRLVTVKTIDAKGHVTEEAEIRIDFDEVLEFDLDALAAAR